ncbi:MULTISPECIES: GNAT family N-acetyltransferase [unclassified Streptomyces]|uniref:GNAT family N-acetyltransferase n=1 Tax=unclassified Streptomyces TaxID=2593676 RepID=UPI002E105BAC|nr:GNAT family N-acetyltransferase [Streptomyces sp. NBC_01197]WSS49220.1 GNAT family N-acetyltransferase [Streptomyces sp. NBC_01180]
MDTELKVLRRDNVDTWYWGLMRAFGGVDEPPEERALWDDLTEFERSIGAWDGDQCVGTTGAFSFKLSVPGGAYVPAAGVTMVSVAATHRRRGILTAMMRRQLDDVRALGEPLAILTASEPAIYGRFGYGIASRQLTAEIDTSRVTLAVPAGTDAVRLRYAPVEEAAAQCEALYVRSIGSRPGMLQRNPGWERLPLLDPPGQREGASPLQCVLAERDGELVGYARFHTKPDSDAAGPRGSVRLRHIDAVDPAACAALWRFLFSIDLMTTLHVRNRPMDDPWQYLVSDFRRCRLQIRDVLHLRLVDVGAALEARTYRVPVDVVLDVEDAFCPWNSGRWRLTGDTGGAACVRSDDPADLELSVQELGAAYLGGTSLTALADAGLVRELRPGSLALASLAFGSEKAPWLPHGF